jgi:DnaJ-class molecular chaperone
VTRKGKPKPNAGDTGMLDATRRHGKWKYEEVTCIRCNGKRAYHGKKCDMCHGKGKILAIR